MKFAIITHTVHKIKEDSFFAYEPYVREMNLWLRNTSETKIIAPISSDRVSPIDEKYHSETISITEIPSFNFLGIKNKMVSLFKLPLILYRIYRVMHWADHIHLRCPGNVGLLGTLVQILFPSKPKTVKYAGNWDPNAVQPLSYRFQKWLVSNTFLTRNCKVLVYGEWGNQMKNIAPFFTASYKKEEIVEISKKEFEQTINFIFVGAFTKSKQPLLSVKVIEKLNKEGVNVQLDMFGNGAEFESIKKYVSVNKLDNFVVLHGNQSKKIVKRAFQKAHFLLFISKSEGWPKVVAEAMFWSCLPISSKVSCVPFMLGDGKRGALVTANVDKIVTVIQKYLSDKKLYQESIKNGKKWSQEYTLNKFELEIKKIVQS